MARTKKITITLTLAEAKALSHAAGNTTEHPDAMESMFPNLHGRKAAWRAHTKLDEAIGKAGGWK